MERLTFALGWVSALGAALMAGAFFAFSSFVMPALARLPTPQGIAAMQAINRAALQRPFLLTFVASGLACLLLALLSVAEWSDTRSRYRLAGSLVYLLGTFLVTRAANVPRNRALDKLDPSSADAGAQWLAYLSEWTAWNHLRSVAALAALALLVCSRLVPGE